jgi:hypothetical protein
MPRSRTASPRTPVAGWTPIRWLAALLAPAVPLAAAILSEITLAVDVQRLLLLLAVAAVGVVLGGRSALVSAAVATGLAGYDAFARRWIVTRPSDVLVLAVFGVTAAGVALAAGARRGASARARDLRRQLALAERAESERQQLAERLAGDVAALRAAAERRERELADARAAAERAERARRELLDSLPPELRAPHERAPRPLQLFPPIFTDAP